MIHRAPLPPIVFLASHCHLLWHPLRGIPDQSHGAEAAHWEVFSCKHLFVGGDHYHECLWVQLQDSLRPEGSARYLRSRFPTVVSSPIIRVVQTRRTSQDRVVLVCKYYQPTPGMITLRLAC